MSLPKLSLPIPNMVIIHSSKVCTSSSPSSLFPPNRLKLTFPGGTIYTPSHWSISRDQTHGIRALPLYGTRRLFLLLQPSVSGIWDALTGGGNNPREAVVAVRLGMQLFRQGDVAGSVAQFDRAIELDSRQKAYLWQRGLSLYYVDRFEEGAEQFRLDVAQNPNDTEESIWCFLCEARIYRVEEARKRFLEVGPDRRPVMSQVYEMFKTGDGDPEKLVAEFSKGGRESDSFYASLYAGLYYESMGNSEKAKKHIIDACQSLYGQRSDDYMASLANIHLLCRNWTANSTIPNQDAPP